ncbi:MAG: endonuclease/exonuclease/phosphatase family protein [Myxococcota bacterium]
MSIDAQGSDLDARAVSRLPTLSREERARMLTLPESHTTHASLLARLPFSGLVETAPPPTPVASAGAALRVVAWNAERGRHAKAGATLLRDSLASVFLLSELDLGMARSGQRHTTRDLASALGCGYAFAVEFLELGLGDEREQAAAADGENAVGYHGGALLSRHGLARPAVVRLEDRGDWFAAERGQRRVGGRIAVLGTLRCGGADITVAAVHLESHGDPEGRAQELARLLDAIDAYAPGAPALIGGDLNTHTLSAAHRADRELLRRDLARDPDRLRRPRAWEPLFEQAEARGYDWSSCNDPEAATQRTASGRGTLKIDWFLQRGLRARDPTVISAVDPQSGTPLSDHEAIAVTVEPP